MKFKANYTLQQMQNMRTKEQLKKKKKRAKRHRNLFEYIPIYIFFSGTRACKLNGSEMQIQRVSDFIR